MTTPSDDWLLSMTCAADGLDHLVTAEAMAAGQVARTGCTTRCAEHRYWRRR